VLCFRDTGLRATSEESEVWRGDHVRCFNIAGLSGGGAVGSGACMRRVVGLQHANLREVREAQKKGIHRVLEGSEVRTRYHGRCLNIAGLSGDGAAGTVLACIECLVLSTQI
jgi:hypothetical protein